VSPGRKYLSTIALQSILAGLLLWLGGLTWGSVQSELVAQEFAGADLDSFVLTVWAVSLAVVIGVLATRIWGRRFLGALGAVVSAIGIYFLVVLEKDGLNALWILAIVLTAGLVITNIVIALASKNWPTLGGKYSRSAPPEQDAWTLLDAGVDPTLESDPNKGLSRD
jgi:purine-cytosine permease-like protein